MVGYERKHMPYNARIIISKQKSFWGNLGRWVNKNSSIVLAKPNYYSTVYNIIILAKYEMNKNVTTRKYVYLYFDLWPATQWIIRTRYGIALFNSFLK